MTPTLIIITLILFGIIALIAEFLLVPGIGIAGILGLGSIIYSAVYAFMQMGTTAGTIVTAVDIVIVVGALIIMLKAKTWKKLELKAEISSSVDNASKQVEVGEHGVTQTRLAPMGTVRFSEQSCEVRSFDGTLVDPKTEVEVVFIENNQIFVKPINN